MSRTVVAISDRYMALDDIGRAARPGVEVVLDEAVWRRIEAGARSVAALAEGAEIAYGVNTGFGSLCRRRVGGDDLARLQHNHLLSHACGVGLPLADAIVRLAILIKLLTFRSGHSGVSCGPVLRLMQFLREDVLPVVPRQGSVGASGDLAPLAHLALPLIGEGFLKAGGVVRPAADVLAERGWPPLTLGPKEGLALTNGVQFLDACATDAVLRAGHLVLCADLVAALSIQGFAAADTFFHPALKATTAHPERWAVIDNLGRLLAGGNHAALPQADPAREDPYSFRCIPQVHAAARQMLEACARMVERDCNSVSDNPLVFAEEGLFLTNGSMHGQTTAFALDILAMALADLASISERRIYQLLSGQRGLPDFLARDPGVDSGLMVWQYTAAALVNESKMLATPSSVDTIMTCQLQEDHVSMGGSGALKAGKVLDNLETVLAIELLAAAAAVDAAAGLRLSPATRGIHAAFRAVSPPLAGDRLMSADLEAARSFLRDAPEIHEALSPLVPIRFGWQAHGGPA